MALLQKCASLKKERNKKGGKRINELILKKREIEIEKALKHVGKCSA